MDKGAALEARRQFGGVTLVREMHREEWSIRWVEEIALDMRHAVRLMWGVPFGLAGSAALSSMIVMSGNPDPLFGVNPRSPETLAGVVGFLIVVVRLASWIPARRAMRIDPAPALRSE